jgi:hypothetical protein
VTIRLIRDYSAQDEQKIQLRQTITICLKLKCLHRCPRAELRYKEMSSITKVRQSSWHFPKVKYIHIQRQFPIARQTFDWADANHPDVVKLANTWPRESLLSGWWRHISKKIRISWNPGKRHINNKRADDLKRYEASRVDEKTQSWGSHELDKIFSRGKLMGRTKYFFQRQGIRRNLTPHNFRRLRPRLTSCQFPDGRIRLIAFISRKLLSTFYIWKISLEPENFPRIPVFPDLNKGRPSQKTLLSPNIRTGNEEEVGLVAFNKWLDETFENWIFPCPPGLIRHFISTDRWEQPKQQWFIVPCHKVVRSLSAFSPRRCGLSRVPSNTLCSRRPIKNGYSISMKMRGFVMFQQFGKERSRGWLWHVAQCRLDGLRRAILLKHHSLLQSGRKINARETNSSQYFKLDTANNLLSNAVSSPFAYFANSIDPSCKDPL